VLQLAPLNQTQNSKRAAGWHSQPQAALGLLWSASIPPPPSLQGASGAHLEAADAVVCGGALVGDHEASLLLIHLSHLARRKQQQSNSSSESVHSRC
jgi:hypothetical protein